MRLPIFLLFITLSFSGCKSILLNRYINGMDKYADKLEPGFSLPDPEGNLVSLSDFEGKLVYLDFWATWCGPCISEIPFSDSLQTRFEDKEEVVFINIALDENYPLWQEMIQERNIRGINLIDTTLSLEEAYYIEALPTYVLIGKNGTVLGYDISGPSEPGVVDYILYKGLEGESASKSIKSLIQNKFGQEDSVWLQTLIMDYPTHFDISIDTLEVANE